MEEISKNDKMFLAIAEKKTKKFDENYEVLLPYRDWNFQLPNNKTQASRRVQQSWKIDTYCTLVSSNREVFQGSFDGKMKILVVVF